MCRTTRSPCLARCITGAKAAITSFTASAPMATMTAAGGYSWWNRTAKGTSWPASTIKNMNKTKTPKNPWTKGEKFLLGAILLTVALAGPRHVLVEADQQPTPSVSVPTPTMPAQNAFDYFNAAATAEVMKNSVDYAIADWPTRPTRHPVRWTSLTRRRKRQLWFKPMRGTLRYAPAGSGLPVPEPADPLVLLPPCPITPSFGASPGCSIWKGKFGKVGAIGAGP